jgi:hypothetical protein
VEDRKWNNLNSSAVAVACFSQSKEVCTPTQLSSQDNWSLTQREDNQNK